MNSYKASSTFSLRDVILNNRLFIDKTRQYVDFINFLDNLPRSGMAPNVNLIVRPRGFGLSLFVDLTEALLRRDRLCEELATPELLQTVPENPVIKIPFSRFRARTVAEFTRALLELLRHEQWEEHIERHYTTLPTPRIFFSNLISDVAEKYGKPPVILLDTYDAVFSTIAAMDPRDQDEALAVYLDTLNALVVSGDEVRWALLTGHTKFLTASEFSEGIPFLHDYSYDTVCDTTFGFTRGELKRFFASELRQFAPYQGLSVREFLRAITQCYGGYSFSDRNIELICPLSVYRLMFAEGMLYPFSYMGDFSFLSRSLKDADQDFNWLFDRDGQDPIFYDFISLHPREKELGALILQQGFATIERVRHEKDSLNWRYRFTMPNVEMRRTFRILRGLSDPKLALQPINPFVPGAYEHAYDR